MPGEQPTEHDPLLAKFSANQSRKYPQRVVLNWFYIFRTILGFGVPSMLLVNYYQEFFAKENKNIQPVEIAIAVGFLSGVLETLALHNVEKGNKKLKSLLDFIEKSRYFSSMLGMMLNVSTTICKLSFPNIKRTSSQIAAYGTVVAISVMTALSYVISAPYLKNKLSQLRKKLFRQQDENNRSALQNFAKWMQRFLQAALAGYQISVAYVVAATLTKINDLTEQPEVALGRLGFGSIYAAIEMAILPFVSHRANNLWHQIEHNTAVVFTYFLEEILAVALTASASEEKDFYKNYLPLILLTLLTVSSVLMALIATAKKENHTLIEEEKRIFEIKEDPEKQEQGENLKKEETPKEQSVSMESRQSPQLLKKLPHNNSVKQLAEYLTQDLHNHVLPLRRAQSLPELGTNQNPKHIIRSASFILHK